MSKPIIAYFNTDAKTAVRAITISISTLGYSIKNTDIETGVVGFETGPSIRTWSGQIMSAHVSEIQPGKVQITIGGHLNTSGPYQLYDWHEAEYIGVTVVKKLSAFLSMDVQRTGRIGVPPTSQAVAAVVLAVVIITSICLFASLGH